MTKFRIKLTLLFIALIGFSVFAAGIWMGNSYEKNHQHALKAHMVRELQVLKAATSWTYDGELPEQKEHFQQQVTRFKDLTGMRITYIRIDGTVLGDSYYDSSTMENHLDREEIQVAIADGVGSGIRYSETRGEKMMYVAVTVNAEDGTIIGIIRSAMSLSAVTRDLQEMWVALIAGLAVLFVLAGAISYRIAFSVTRPLERMTAAAKRMAQMDYEIRVPERGRDELGELGRTLNAMAASLQEQMDKIRRNGDHLQQVLDNMPTGVMMIESDGRISLFNLTAQKLLGGSPKERVGRSYTEIKQHYELTSLIANGLDDPQWLKEELTVYFPEERVLEANLVPMNKSGEHAGLLLVLQDVSPIRRLERMRSEFVANVSHELKTPVAAVKGFTETLLAGAMNEPETANAFLNIILDESERLNRLIGDILELSQIESRRSTLQFSPIELHAFLSRLIEVLSPEASRKGIAMELEAAEELFMEADEDRFGQILRNLIQNSINYTPEGGHVKVSALLVHGTAEEEDQIRITVADTGIGIPKKDMPRIFERFYRVDKARSRSSGGTGLGLSIVKHLTELHHGSIRVESTVGVGSKFILELPVLQD